MIVRGFMPGTAGMRGIAVGTPQGMHFAFDSERCALSAVWTGDFAEIGGWYDNGRGKPEENGLKPLGKIIWRGTNDPVFLEDGRRPELSRLNPRFRSISADAEGVTVEYVLPRSEGRSAPVIEHWKPLEGNSGFERTFKFPQGSDAALKFIIGEATDAVAPSQTEWNFENSGHSWHVKSAGGVWNEIIKTDGGRNRILLGTDFRSDAPMNTPTRLTYRLIQRPSPDLRDR
jgi:hypothetical protein